MAVWHDYRCEKHGDFESTHDICPHMGCDSSKVTLIFKKAPGIMSGKTKAFDKGIRHTAESYQLDYLKSAQREGDSSYGGHAADAVLWGDKAAAAFGGPEALAAAAQAGIAESNAFVAQRNRENATQPNAKMLKRVADGMRTTATDMGLTQHVEPPKTIQYSDRGVK